MYTYFELVEQTKASTGIAFENWADMSLEVSEKFSDAMADRVLASIESYPANVVSWAKKRKGSLYYQKPVTTYGAGEAIRDFSGEVLSQAASINENVNPFSESNRKSILTRVLIVATVIAAVYFLFPRIVSSFRRA